MRSLATISSRPACGPSVIRYRSRTLPEWMCSAPSIAGAAGMFRSPLTRGAYRVLLELPDLVAQLAVGTVGPRGDDHGPPRRGELRLLGVLRSHLALLGEAGGDQCRGCTVEATLLRSDRAQLDDVAELAARVFAAGLAGDHAGDQRNVLLGREVLGQPDRGRGRGAAVGRLRGRSTTRAR